MKKIAIFCSANNNIDAEYFKKAQELGEWIGKNNDTLVYGGCDMGLMECLAKAVHAKGGQVIGVVPQKIEKNGHVSKYIDIEIPCQDLTDRKALMMAQSDVVIALPGGLGTLDEIFTVAAAATIGYTDKKVILYNINGFWDSLLIMLHEMQQKNFMRESLSEHIVSVRKFEELKEQIEQA
jgi:uncharacterized protein (TIGR00730 family)